MRIATGGVQHETNTFAQTPTTLADFQRDSECGPDFAGGDTIRRLYQGTGTIHGGYLEAAAGAGVEIAPLLCAPRSPPASSGRRRSIICWKSFCAACANWAPWTAWRSTCTARW